jgi:hypothetical protein
MNQRRRITGSSARNIRALELRIASQHSGNYCLDIDGDFNNMEYGNNSINSIVNLYFNSKKNIY